MEKKFVLSIFESENTKYGDHPCGCSECSHRSINFEPSADEAAVKELCTFVNRVTHSEGKLKELRGEDFDLLSRVLGTDIGSSFIEATYWEYQEPNPEPPLSVSEALRRLRNPE
jgi:hypothetical protein